MAAPPPLVLLELILISAQDLKKPPSSVRRLQAYALVWLDPSAKLRTLTDRTGGSNPTWNDRFLFRLPASSLHPESTSAIQIEIYDSGLLFDSFLGSVRLLLSNLRLQSLHPGAPSFAAFGIRRPSGSFHGALNVGAVVLPEGHAPAAAAAAPAMGFRELMRWRASAQAGKVEPLKEKNREEKTGNPEEEETLTLERRGEGGRCWPGPSRKIHLSSSDSALHMKGMDKENRW